MYHQEHHQDVDAIIAAARGAIHGEYVSISRVADTLLDLRSLAADVPELVELIDRTLGSMPGRTVVPNTWWLDSLDAIARLAGETCRPVDVVAG